MRPVVVAPTVPSAAFDAAMSSFRFTALEETYRAISFWKPGFAIVLQFLKFDFLDGGVE